MSEAAKELLPCPFCGSENTIIDHITDAVGDERWVAYCDECLISTAGIWDRDGSVKIWNTRHEAARPAPADEGVSTLVEWVPCADRQPRVDDEYLVTFRWCDEGEELYTYVMQYSDGRWSDIDENGSLSGREILAWAPLPIPYQLKNAEVYVR